MKSKVLYKKPAGSKVLWSSGARLTAVKYPQMWLVAHLCHGVLAAASTSCKMSLFPPSRTLSVKITQFCWH